MTAVFRRVDSTHRARSYAALFVSGEYTSGGVIIVGICGVALNAGRRASLAQAGRRGHYMQ
ncbi:MAG: hypothetical protein ACREUC_02635 [Steroidobacteraceae bacterium]